MRQMMHVFSAVAFVFGTVAGCGTTVRPNVRAGDGNPPSGMFPGGRLGPRPDSDRGMPDESQPIVDEVCRAQAMRSGWIAIRYVQGEGDCPVSTDSANTYTVAVIERHSHKPVGAMMTVCADQTIPREWVRASNRDASGTCQGARVGEGASTVMVIRKVASR